jgi:hypothetical protein
MRAPAGRLTDGEANALGDGARAFLVGLGENDTELLAAVASSGVEAADGFPNGVGHPAEDLVADLMTVRVVEALEEVDIGEQDRGVMPRPVKRRVALEPSGFGFEAPVELAVVGQTGQRIRHGHRSDARVQVRVGQSESGMLAERAEHVDLALSNRGGTASASPSRGNEETVGPQRHGDVTARTEQVDEGAVDARLRGRHDDRTAGR